MTRIGILLALGVTATAGMAAEPTREFCASRPGLDTGPCVIEPGHFQIETGLANFTHEHDADGTTDTLLGADTLVRIGLGETNELQVGWTPFGHVRMRDAATGQVSHMSRVGDATLAFRQNLRHPDGSGTSLAVQPFVTVPVGRRPVGEGDWAGGILLAISFELTDAITLTLDPEADAAVDEDGDGRHLAYGGVVSLGFKLAETVKLAVEYAGMRDRDPMGHDTISRASTALAWQRGENSQFDLGAIAGLNHNSPDVEVYFGVTRRF